MYRQRGSELGERQLFPVSQSRSVARARGTELETFQSASHIVTRFRCRRAQDRAWRGHCTVSCLAAGSAQVSLEIPVSSSSFTTSTLLTCCPPIRDGGRVDVARHSCVCLYTQDTGHELRRPITHCHGIGEPYATRVPSTAAYSMASLAMVHRRLLSVAVCRCLSLGPAHKQACLADRHVLVSEPRATTHTSHLVGLLWRATNRSLPQSSGWRD